MNEFKPIIKVDEEKITGRVNEIIDMIPRCFKLSTIANFRKCLSEYYQLGIITENTFDYYYDMLNENEEIALERAARGEN